MKFPNRILIVDDVPLDRASLRTVVTSVFPDSVILEASNADEMWARLDIRCDLLFQDISLNPTDGVVDSEGVRLLYDVIETFSSLPVIIVSGHMPEKWKDVFNLQKQHGSPLIDVLDKLDYDSKIVVGAIEKAHEFHIQQAARVEEEDYVSKLLSEVTEEHENAKKLEREKQEAEKNNQSKEAKLRDQMLSGDDPLVRCKAEVELNGHCGMNLWPVCVEFEDQVLKISGLNTDTVSFHAKVRTIKSEYGLRDIDVRDLFDAWSIRNKMAHPPQLKPNLNHATLMIDSLNILVGLHSQ
jgi:DNA-binding NarL/FixJ family response regulator